jgi:ABC-type uncharacterized transport system substrate-binding protein
MPNPVPAFRESARRPPRWSGRRHRTPAIRSELSRCQPCSAGRQHHRYVLGDRRTRSKTLEVIREIIPSVRRVAVLPNSTDPFTKSFLKQIGIGAQIQGLEIQVIMIKGADEPIAAFASIKKNAADAVIVQPSLPRIRVADLALKYRVLVIAPSDSFAAEGGLAAYAASQSEMAARSAAIIGKILKAANRPTCRSSNRRNLS